MKNVEQNTPPPQVILNFEGLKNTNQMVSSKDFYENSIENGLKRSEV